MPAILFSEDRESVGPSHNVEIVRRCDFFDIDGEIYKNVVATLKSNDGFFSSYVKVKIEDKSGNVVYNKKFKDSFLYVFSVGDVYVGKPNLTWVMIFPHGEGANRQCLGTIREKEGIY